MGDLRRNKNELEGTLQSLMAENARLSDLSIQRLKEIDVLKVKYSKNSEVDPAIMNQLDNYRKATNDFRDQLLKADSNRRANESQIQRLNQVIENNTKENQRLYDVLNERKNDNDTLMKQVIKGISILNDLLLDRSK